MLCNIPDIDKIKLKKERVDHKQLSIIITITYKKTPSKKTLSHQILIHIFQQLMKIQMQ
jgi:hypothetical protein